MYHNVVLIVLSKIPEVTNFTFSTKNQSSSVMCFIAGLASFRTFYYYFFGQFKQYLHLFKKFFQITLNFIGLQHWKRVVEEKVAIKALKKEKIQKLLYPHKLLIMDIENVDIVIGKFVLLIQVAIKVLRYWSIRSIAKGTELKLQKGGGGYCYNSQLGETFYQVLEESLTIFTYSLSILLIYMKGL